MSGGDHVLTPWDLALLDRHRPFYTALASGTRQPTTALQAHFVAAAHGHTLPVTQHEIAFRRFREGWRDPRSERAGLPQPGASGVLMPGCPGRIERCVDLADAAQLETLASLAGRTFRHMRGLYITGKATARRRGTDAAVWISTALADAGVAGSLERWTSEQFGGLSDIYTKALDGAFAKGLEVGADYVDPLLHRLFGGHTPAAAWRTVRDALPDDTPAEELIGWLQALGSDFVTVVGLPLVELTPEAFGRLEIFLSDMLGLSREQLVEALHVNAVEGLQFASGYIPLVAVAMGWGQPDANAFARLAGSLGVGGVVATNPIMGLVLLLMLARAYQLTKTGEAKGLWRPTVEGGATTGMALAIAAAIGGQSILGVAAGLVVAGGLRAALNGRSGIEGSRWVDRSAARIASIISTLQGSQGRVRSPVGL
jgi:hypothetical protein